MATLENIRKMSPSLLGIFVVVFILFMVFSDMNINSLMQQGVEYQNTVIAVVDGTELKTKEYDELNKQITDNMKYQQTQQGNLNFEVDETVARTQTWNAMIEQTIMSNLTRKAGLTINEAVVADMIVNNPPDEIKKQFADSLGNFMKDVYVKIATNYNSVADIIGQNPNLTPEQITQQKQQAIKQYKEMFEYYTSRYTNQRLAVNAQTLLNEAGSNLSYSYVRDKYIAENSTADIQYIKFDMNLISNDQVNISDEEIKAYYEKNKKKYKEEEKRKIKFVSFPLVASAKDSLKAQNIVSDISTAILSSVSPEQKKKAFDTKMLAYNGIVNDFALISDIDPLVSKYIGNVAVGEIAGPVQNAGGKVSFYRLDDRRTGDSTKTVVRVAHILLKTNPAVEDSVKVLANKIAKKAKSGTSFEELVLEYSADNGTKFQKGDLGFFARGANAQMPEFEEASFNASVGEITKPVKTRFGYHIIKVLDRNSNELKYSEINVAVKMSGTTRRTLFAQAHNLFNRANNGENLSELAEKLGMKALETAPFGKESPILGSQKVSSFVFANILGATMQPQEFANYGAVVIQISDIKKASIATLETKTPVIKNKLIVDKKLDILKAQADKVYSQVSASNDLSSAGESNPELRIKFAPTLNNNGILPSSNQNEPLITNTAFTTDLNKISAPIRGKYAYYMIKVNSRNVPDKATVDAAIDQYYVSELFKVKRATYYSWLAAIKENTKIEDNRLGVYSKY